MARPSREVIVSTVSEDSVSSLVRGRPRFLARLLRRPVAIAAGLFLAALVIAAIAAPLIAPYGPGKQDLYSLLSGPTGDHLLGTDTLGRDVLSRLLYGARTSLLAIVEAVAAALVVGVPLGLIAGYFGGWWDRILSRAAEALIAVPGIVLVLVVLAVLPQNEHAAMLMFGFLGAPMVLRVVRSAALKVREEPYIAAARVSGLSHVRIMVRHVLPRVRGPIIVQASIFAAYALVFETGLAYLGLTADPTTATWGGMVAEASTVITQDGWLLAPAGLTIAITILALGLLGDAVRDASAVHGGRMKPSARRARPLRVAAAPPDAADRSSENRSGAPLLRVANLSIAAAGEKSETTVVDGLSFELGQGETVGLVGESGCGKSVTALAVLRLLPRALRPTGGHAYWEGVDVLGMSSGAYDQLRGSTFGYVSQEPHASLDPTFTIGSQLVEVVRRHDDVSRSAAKARAAELLRLVDLTPRVAESRAHQLSGGMAQRVSMALALAGRPKLLIADEPTTALDVTVQAEILGLLRRLQGETGMAILLITHDWGVVADLCDRTIVMYAGQVVEQCRTQEMFDTPLHPYTLGLMGSHPSLAEPGADLTAIPGRVPSPEAWPSGCRFAPRCEFARDECRAGPVPLFGLEGDRSSRCVCIDEIFAQKVGV
jgi:peptide/nickel transport system permease protein